MTTPKIGACESLLLYPVKDAKGPLSTIMRVVLSILIGMVTLGVLHLCYHLKSRSVKDKTSEGKEKKIDVVTDANLPVTNSVTTPNPPQPLVPVRATITEAAPPPPPVTQPNTGVPIGPPPPPPPPVVPPAAPVPPPVPVVVPGTEQRALRGPIPVRQLVSKTTGKPVTKEDLVFPAARKKVYDEFLQDFFRSPVPISSTDNLKTLSDFGLLNKGLKITLSGIPGRYTYEQRRTPWTSSLRTDVVLRDAPARALHEHEEFLAFSFVQMQAMLSLAKNSKDDFKSCEHLNRLLDNVGLIVFEKNKEFYVFDAEAKLCKIPNLLLAQLIEARVFDTKVTQYISAGILKKHEGSVINSSERYQYLEIC